MSGFWSALCDHRPLQLDCHSAYDAPPGLVSAALWHCRTHHILHNALDNDRVANPSCMLTA